MQIEEGDPSLFENGAEGIYQSNAEGKIVTVNQAMAEILGYDSPADFLANLPDFDHEYFAIPGHQAEYKHLLDSQGFVREFEALALRKDGSTIWVSIDAHPVQDAKGGLLYYQGVVTDIAQRKLSEGAVVLKWKETRRLAKEASVMAEIGRIIGSNLNIYEVFEKFSATAKKLISFDRIVITVINHDTQTICNAYVSGVEVMTLPLGNTVPLAGSVSEEILRTRKGLLIQEENQGEFLGRFPAILNTFQAGLRSMISVPLFSRDQVIGTLHLRSLERNAYAAKDLELAQRIADQIAGAIANAQLYKDLKMTTEALRENKERYQALFEGSRDCVYIHDFEGNFIAANAAALKLLGYERGEIDSLKFSSMLSEDQIPKALKTVAELKQTGKQKEITEFKLVRKDGGLIDVETMGSAIYRDGKPYAIQGIARNITDRKKKEEALRKSEEKFSKAFQASPAAITISTQNDGKYIDVNESFVKISGYTREEAIGRTALELGIWDRDGRNRYVKMLQSKGRIKNKEFRFRVKSGELRTFLTSAEIIEIEGKSCVISVNEDITERQRAEEALRKSEKKYRSVIENIQDVFYRSDLDGRLSMVSPSGLAMFGYESMEEMIGLPLESFWANPRDRAPVVELLKAGGRVRGVEAILRRKDGTTFDGIFDTHCYYDDQGNILGTEGIIRDISERKRADEVLKRSEREAQSLLKETAIMAEIGRIISSSLEIEEVYDRFAAEMKKLVPFDRISINEVNIAEGKAGPLYTTGLKVPSRRMGDSYSLEGTVTEKLVQTRSGLLVQGNEMEEFVRQNPSYLPVYNSGIRSMIAVPLISRDRTVGTFFLASVQPDSYSERDLELAQRISNQIAGAIANAQLFRELRRTDEHLRESEERYRQLVENAPLGIISVDPEGNIKKVNSHLLSILNSPSEEATRGINLFSFPPLMEAGIAGNFRRCLDSGKAGVFETAYHSKWGKDSYLRYHLTPIRDREGRITGAQAIVEDISERKNLEGQLLQAQKMEAIGTLAGGIAHDFNNILTAISGYLELAVLDLSEDSKLKYNLGQSLQAAHRAKDLVRQILAFSRQGKQERKPMDISPIVKESLKLLRASLPATIEIRHDCEEEDLGIVEADPTQIHQVLMNLSTNAARAMEEKGGILTVSLSKVDIGQEASVAYGGIRPNRYLRLRVSDTGHGMTPEIMKRIFDPYFTTKEIGKGTGLGLAVVHGIVKSYGGEIEVSSEPGKGTTFDVLFPRSDRANIVLDGTQNASLSATGKERILFVDDEGMIAEIGGKMLERLGYEVAVRTSSIEALELFRAQPERFDLVITDMTMPNMTGDKLAQAIMKIRPEIPVILVTGFSEQMTEEKAKALGIREYVMKPPVTNDFAKAIRRALDREGK